MAEAAETVVHTSGAAATRLVEHKCAPSEPCLGLPAGRARPAAAPGAACHRYKAMPVGIMGPGGADGWQRASEPPK